MYKEQIDAYIESKEEEMLADLSALVRINSVQGEAKEGKPFGEGPAAALKEAESLLEKCGMQVKNYENYVVTGDLDGAEDKALDILAHLDVVPVSQNWKVTDPFAPKITEGRIYGRGTADDKGPAVAAMYAMRAVKELGIPLKKGVRLILGANEETGSADLAYYYAKEKEAEYSFTPDAEYPLINLEKGHLIKKFTTAFKDSCYEPALVRFDAGTAVNIVPAEASALVSGMTVDAIRRISEPLEKELSVVFSLSDTDQGVEINAKGIAAHASTPELGCNAITALLTLLDALPLASSDKTEAIAALCRLFPHGDTEGKALGVAMHDEVSGALTMNLGILHISEQGLEGALDSRCPVCGTDANVTEVIRAKLLDAGMQMEEGGMTPVHYVSADSPLVQTLLGCYEDYFGQKGEALAIGGGTYVHDLKRGVAFGCMVPETDNHMHGDDEFMEIEMLKRSAKIFAQAIIRLCG